MQLLKTHASNMLIGVGILFYFIALFLTQSDVNFSRQWVSFGIYIISLLCVVGSYLLKTLHSHHYKTAKDTKEALFFVLILVIAETISFVFLVNYPYVSVHDELRDGGLYAAKILNGSIPNLFGYGAYGSQSLII